MYIIWWKLEVEYSNSIVGRHIQREDGGEGTVRKLGYGHNGDASGAFSFSFLFFYYRVGEVRVEG